MSGGEKTTAGSGRDGGYFFVSYAHSPPLPGGTDTDPDQSVELFFADLSRAVRRRATSARGAVGYLDQMATLSSDWKASLTRALATTQVLVPLYSPSYLTRSLPGREWASFYQRLVLAGHEQPIRRFAPVLWVPLPVDQDPPGLQEALALGAGEPEYAENGLRALLRLAPYQDTYRRIVDRLAVRIVELAENAPLRPSGVPDIDEVAGQFAPEAAPAMLTVTVAAPTAAGRPPGRDERGYGASGTEWRPFPDQQLPLAGYAADIAEKLDFAPVISGMEKKGDRINGKPGILLIDPWFVADEQGSSMLRTFVAELPPWVLPLQVRDERSGALTERVRAILDDAETPRSEAARIAVEGVRSLEEFVKLVPALVAEAERQFLRHAPFPSSNGAPGTRPRLTSNVRPVEES